MKGSGRLLLISTPYCPGGWEKRRWVAVNAARVLLYIQLVLYNKQTATDAIYIMLEEFALVTNARGYAVFERESAKISGWMFKWTLKPSSNTGILIFLCSEDSTRCFRMRLKLILPFAFFSLSLTRNAFDGLCPLIGFLSVGAKLNSAFMGDLFLPTKYSIY